MSPAARPSNGWNCNAFAYRTLPRAIMRRTFELIVTSIGLVSEFIHRHTDKKQRLESPPDFLAAAAATTTTIKEILGSWDAHLGVCRPQWALRLLVTSKPSCITQQQPFVKKRSGLVAINLYSTVSLNQISKDCRSISSALLIYVPWRLICLAAIYKLQTRNIIPFPRSLRPKRPAITRNNSLSIQAAETLETRKKESLIITSASLSNLRYKQPWRHASNTHPDSRSFQNLPFLQFCPSFVQRCCFAKGVEHLQRCFPASNSRVGISPWERFSYLRYLDLHFFIQRSNYIRIGFFFLSSSSASAAFLMAKRSSRHSKPFFKMW